MNTLSNSPIRIQTSRFPSTPEYCPFSVEIETAGSQSFDHLMLSTVNKSWSLAMRTTRRGSDILETGESEDQNDTEADEFPLNQMDLEIKQAISNEKTPVGLAPISSDSESSSRDESVDYDSEDEGKHVRVPRIPGAREMPCGLSPRLSKTPSRGEHQQNAPPNPLNPLKVLNPGIPQNHASHRNHRRHNSHSRLAMTPQRGDSNALVTANSNAAATTSAADCMCFPIEDVLQFFCPATPKSTTMDNAQLCPPGTNCFPAYEYGVTASPAIGGGFPSIQGFFVSPKNSPRPRSREEQLVFLLNSKLPRNRSHALRRKHVRKLLSVWHGAEEEDEWPSSLDDFSLIDKRQRRRKRNSLVQPKFCYDSDPEQEVLGRTQRRSSLFASSRSEQCLKSQDMVVDQGEDMQSETQEGQPHFQKFRPEPFTHLDTDEETTSHDDESSYETAKCSSSVPSEPSEPSKPPSAPRNSDPKMSFDFAKDLDVNELASEDPTSEHDPNSETTVSSSSQGSPMKGHQRVLSSTSLSTTGHSRFHTIRLSPEQAQEDTDSSMAPSDEFSSISGSTTRSSKMEQPLSTLQQHTLPSYFQTFPTHWTEFQLLFSRNVDEESVKSHVHELSNVRFPLVWHPGAPSSNQKRKTKTEDGKPASKGVSVRDIHCSTSAKIASLANNGPDPKSKDNDSSRNRKGTPFPISVVGAVEVGAHLEHMVVQPKFTWMPVAQPHRISKDSEVNQRELFLSGSSPPQIELLSIIRVNKAHHNQLDRNLYPYARADRTCIVSTNDSNHPTIVLEARSTQERDWLVFSLKLIVARLASIIITRDEDMLHEFFSPYSALMRLEEEEVASQENSNNEDGSEENSHVEEDKECPTIECESTPTPTCGKAVVVIDEEGSSAFVFPKDSKHDDYEDEDALSTDSGIPLDEESPETDMDTDDDTDLDDCAYQHRDDKENEDSIRARNSGAFAILKRSLTATGPLTDYDEPCYHQEEHMLRTFSY